MIDFPCPEVTSRRNSSEALQRLINSENRVESYQDVPDIEVDSTLWIYGSFEEERGDVLVQDREV